MPAEPATPRLLYIDPDEAAALRLARGLGTLGMDVTHLPAVSSLRAAHDYDAVLVGQSGATIAGEDAAEALINEGTAPPAICLVAQDRPDILLAAIEHGVDEALAYHDQPEFPALVAATVRRAVARAAIARQARLARIEAEEARERAEVLLNEMKHRIANSLALVVSIAHLHAGSMDRGEAQRAVEDFADKVHTFAQVHKGLYASMNIGTVALDTYLAQLARELHRNHVGRRALGDLRLECIPLSVNVDQAISLGVIFAEFVSNAARYAYPGKTKGEVRAAVRMSDTGEVLLVVEDDGAGLGGDGPVARPGLGSQIVGVLAHGLGGWFELKPREQGMAAVLHFPLPEHHRTSATEETINS
jgi:two-component sensor histidine kinase